MNPVDRSFVTDFKRGPRRRDPDLMRLLHLDPGPCCVTGEFDTVMHLHHIVPRARGGDDSRENLCWMTPETHRRYHSGLLSPEELDRIVPLCNSV